MYFITNELCSGCKTFYVYQKMEQCVKSQGKSINLISLDEWDKTFMYNLSVERSVSINFEKLDRNLIKVINKWMAFNNVEKFNAAVINRNDSTFVFTLFSDKEINKAITFLNTICTR